MPIMNCYHYCKHVSFQKKQISNNNNRNTNINQQNERNINTSSNPEIPIKVSKIILNISKNHNSQNKLIFENSLNFNSLIEILLVNLNAYLA